MVLFITVSPLVKDRQCLVPSIDRWSRHIVFLENGNTWGTGLVADGHRGIIITCSHVVRAANSGNNIHCINLLAAELFFY